MMNNIVELAKKAQNVEELIALAKEAGVEIALEEAKKIFAQICVDDLELENVSGGASDISSQIKSLISKSYW